VEAKEAPVILDLCKDVVSETLKEIKTMVVSMGATAT